MEPFPDPRRPRPAPSRWPLYVLLAVALLLLARELTPWFRTLHDPDARPRVVTPRGDLAADEESTIELFERWRRSVVHITTTRTRQRSRFTRRTIEVPQGQGSGFVWDEAGYVVTNFHVLGGAERAYVQFADGELLEGFFVGGSADHDLAVLRVAAPASLLHPVAIGTSADLAVGQKVFAIGNPYGFDWTLTTGVVSGLNRSILSVARTPIDGVIQTDAAINPGNSGGPLLDSAGRLIGVNTAIYSPTGSSAGIGFAVPVDTVNMVVPQIIASGRPERAGLGVRLVPDADVRAAGLEGAVVADVSPGSAAARAGLRGLSDDGRAFDRIVAVDDEPVRSQGDLLRALGEHDVGEEVVLEVVRDDERVRLPVTLQDVR